MAPLDRIGLGTAALGHLYRAVSDGEAEAVVAGAYAAGIRFFDTAHLYGGGLAEERLGRALRALPRDSYRVATKIGSYRPFGQPATPPGSTVRRSADVWDFSYDRTCAAVETSLRRLGTDRIDIVHVHGFDRHREEALSGAFPALRRFREERVIGAVGGASDAMEPLLWAIERGLIDTLLTAGRYTLIDRTAAEQLLPRARATGVETIVGGVFNSGILARGAVSGAPFDYDPASEPVLARVRAIETLCEAHGTALRTAALQFPLRSAAIDRMLLGPSSEAELRDCLDRLAAPVPGGLWQQIDAFPVPPTVHP